MAIGGALRSAIKLGRFSVAARESRRQARILQSAFPDGARGLDPQRGRMLPLEERGFERMMGQGYGGTARGNAIVVDPASGRRIVVNQNFDDFMEGLPAGGRGPIEAPYEGMRVWPGKTLPGFGEPMQIGAMPGARMDSIHAGVPFTTGSAPPWIGAGPAPTPTTGRFFPRDMSTGGGRMYNEELGSLQGQEFFAPSIPVPFRRPSSWDQFVW